MIPANPAGPEASRPGGAAVSGSAAVSGDADPGGDGAAAPIGTPRVIGELVRDRARRLADQEFLRFHDQAFTYADIDRLSDAAARGLLAQGVSKGDKVSIMLPNRPEFLHVWFGAAKIGAVEVPRDEYLAMLEDALAVEAHWPADDAR